jgi:hypothetical protein
MKQRIFHHQQGIALGPLLFIIAILAIIAAAIAAGAGGFNTNTNNDSAKVMAQAVIDYVGQVKNGLDLVLANNQCNTTVGTEQLSFSNPIATAANGNVDPYINANAPANASCNIFDQRGGGIIAKAVPQGMQISSSYPTYLFSGCNEMANSGPTNEPITVLLLGLSNTQCSAINSILTGSSAISSTAAFNPVFYPGADNGGCAWLGTIPMPSACVYETTSNMNIFYSVLLPR